MPGLGLVTVSLLKSITFRMAHSFFGLPQHKFHLFKNFVTRKRRYTIGRISYLQFRLYKNWGIYIIMSFDDKFKISVHAVILNGKKQILQLKQTYADLRWGLPGGSIEPGETIHEALLRECKEELGCDIEIECLTGVYYHKAFNSQVFIFRCSLPTDATITLSSEHSEFRYFELKDLSPIQMHRIQDCLSFDGKVKSAKF